ncbi:hypothetical protein ABZP36_002458 [Zizania latifolia]
MDSPSRTRSVSMIREKQHQAELSPEMVRGSSKTRTSESLINGASTTRASKSPVSSIQSKQETGVRDIPANLFDLEPLLEAFAHHQREGGSKIEMRTGSEPN